MTLIIISDKICWLCGEQKNNITEHHALPQYLKPKHNIKIPICKDCHDLKINVSDVGGIYAYAYKIEKLSKQAKVGAFQLRKLVQRNIDTKNEETNNNNQD